MKKSTVIKSILGASSLLIASGLTACNSGGSGGGGGGGDTGATVTTIATLSSTSVPYSPLCMYTSDHDDSFVFVKKDGSGSGAQYVPGSSTVTNISSGLPVISSTDTCLANVHQLTWVDSQNNVHVYQGGTTQTAFDVNQVYNLSGTGLSSDEIKASSFGSSTSDFNLLFANRNYPAANFGISDFSGLNPTGYTAFPTGSLTGRTNTVVYGFTSATNDNGDVFVQQLLPTSGNTPATLVTAAHNSDSTETIDYTVNFVNASNAAISDMSGAVDYLETEINNKANYIIETGLVQPNFYVCNTIVSTQNTNITMSCGNPITSSSLTSQYRVLRLLSYDGSKIVFFGLNVQAQSYGIFSIQ